MVSWMVDNQERLRGEQMSWHEEEDAKEQMFEDEEHIAVKKITDKAGQLYIDNEKSVNDILLAPGERYIL